MKFKEILEEEILGKKIKYIYESLETIKNKVMSDESLKIYTTFPAEKNIEYSIEKVKDGFDMFKGQIVHIGLRSHNKVIYQFPILIIKVNQPDINGHNTYDYLTLIGKEEGITSVIIDKKRYLWRFVTAYKYNKADNYLLEYLKKYYEENKELEGIVKEDIMYLNKENKIEYPYRKAK